MFTKNSAQEILRRSLKRVSLKLAALLFCAFVLLEAFVLYKTQVTSVEKTMQWVQSKKPEIEQALFLENHLSVNGIIDNFSSELPKDIHAQISVFNSYRERIYGHQEIPVQLSFGVKRSLIDTRYSYFDVLTFGDVPQGYIYIQGYFDYRQIFFHTFLVMMFLFGIFILSHRLLNAFTKVLGTQILNPIYTLQRHMGKTAANGNLEAFSFPAEEISSEVKELMDGYNNLIRHILDQQHHIRSLASQKAFAIIAKQVAHDIRSPLSALNMVSEFSKSLPDNEKAILISAIKRINDIANNLISKPSQMTQAKHQVSLCFIPAVLTGIVAEKRMQYRKNKLLKISEKIGGTLNVFTLVDTSEFKRVISNLIDNAVESIDSTDGLVLIELATEADQCTVRVRDNGRGIPKNYFPKLGTSGFTYGKAGGTGLGLHHAFKTIGQAQGLLVIDSTERKGTAVTITLPKIECPKWFCQSISVNSKTVVIVLDDDESQSLVWKRLLNGAHINGFHQFKTVEASREFLRYKSFEELLILADLELGIDHDNGLELLTDPHLSAQKILVTNHWDDEQLQLRLSDTGIKLIPKDLIYRIAVHNGPEVHIHVEA